MAKKKSSKKSASSDENVVRIKASSAPKSKKSDKKEVVEAEVVTKVAAKNSKKAEKTVKAEKATKPEKVDRAKGIRGGGILKPFRAMGGYFKGAWVELRQVRWPTRKATWELTFAVLMYTAFFILLVLLLDAAFKYMFDLILGK